VKPRSVAAKRTTSAVNVIGAAIALQAPGGSKGFTELGCVDRIDTIVEMAINYTRTVLRTAPEYFDVARGGLERLRTDLMREVPEHPALERLRSFQDEIAPHEIEGSLH
jgi:hypothetical protein